MTTHCTAEPLPTLKPTPSGSSSLGALRPQPYLPRSGAGGGGGGGGHGGMTGVL
jgi:hypothetical protein